MKRFILAVIIGTTLLFGAGCKPPTSNTTTTEGMAVKHGVVNPSVTQSNIKTTICQKGWTKTIRPSYSYTSKIKNKMIEEQNWKGPAILDHYIPLQGGGAPSDPRNFILQTPKDSYIKDSVEDHMNKDICTRALSLKEAQKIMGNGWESYDKESARAKG